MRRHAIEVSRLAGEPVSRLNQQQSNPLTRLPAHQNNLNHESRWFDFAYHGPTKHLRTGFTFIEILFVVIILGILTGVSLPQFKKSARHFGFSSFCGEFQGAMKYFQHRSIVEARALFFVLDLRNRQYWARYEDQPARIKVTAIPQGIVIEADKKEIVFYPDGSIDKVDVKISRQTPTNSASGSDGEALVLTTRGVFNGFKVSTEAGSTKLETNSNFP